MNSIKHIRKSLFGVTQTEFGAKMGVNQSTVSRWEREELDPSLSELRQIRDLAKAQNMDWSDSLIFDVPEVAA